MKKYSFLIYPSLTFLVGIGVDRIIRNFPILEFDGKVNIVDAVNLAVVIILGVFITKIIEDKKGVKLFIIDEFKDLLKILSNIKSIIEQCRNKNSISKDDKDKLLFATHEADLMVDSIESQMKVAYKTNCSKIVERLKKVVIEYQRMLIGGRLMTSGFTVIDDPFYDGFLTNHSVSQTAVKTLIQEIYRL